MADALILPVWPPTLPIAPLLADFNEVVPGLATNMVTANKSLLIRRTCTRRQHKLNVAFHFTRLQTSYFEQFYNDGLLEGKRRFEFVHPRTTRIIEVSFDPTEEQVYTITPYITEKMEHYKVVCRFIVWD